MTLTMAERTRSKSSSKTSSTENEAITLSVVKELMKEQEETMRSFIETLVKNTNERIDKLSAEMKGVIDSLEYTQGEVNDLKIALKKASELSANERNELETKTGAVESKVRETETKVREIEAKADDLENRSRRNNLCFDGVAEDANESWSTSEKKIREIIGAKLHIKTDELTIERAHRAGKGNASSGKPRTIVAKFNNYKIREQVLRNKKGLKGTNVFVREDFSQKTLAKRRELLPAMHEERRKGNIAFLRYDKLVVYPNLNRRENQQPSQSTRSPQLSPFAGRGRGQNNAWTTPIQRTPGLNDH